MKNIARVLSVCGLRFILSCAKTKPPYEIAISATFLPRGGAFANQPIKGEAGARVKLEEVNAVDPNSVGGKMNYVLGVIFSDGKLEQAGEQKPIGPWKSVSRRTSYLALLAALTIAAGVTGVWIRSRFYPRPSDHRSDEGANPAVEPAGYPRRSRESSNARAHLPLDESIGLRKEVVRKALSDFVGWHRAQGMDEKLSKSGHDFRKRRQGVFLAGGGPHWDLAVAYNNAVWSDGASLLALLQVVDEERDPEVRRLARQYLSAGMAAAEIPRADFFATLFEEGVADILAQRASESQDEDLKWIALDGLFMKLSDGKWQQERDSGNLSFLHVDSLKRLADLEEVTSDVQTKTPLVRLLAWLYRDQLPEFKNKLLTMATSDQYQPALRRAALEGLKDPDLKDPGILTAVRDILKREKDPALIHSALDVYASGGIVGPGDSQGQLLYETVREIVASTSDDSVRSAGVEVIARYDTPEAARLLADMYPQMGSDIKVALFERLAFSGFLTGPRYETARASYEELALAGTSDTRGDVRKAAYSAALSFCASGFERGEMKSITASRRLLQRMNADSDPSIRELAKQVAEQIRNQYGFEIGP